MRSVEAVNEMLCPVCKVGLALSDRQGVEIDYCPQCRGVWLDRGELDKIVDRNNEYAGPARAGYPDDDRSAVRTVRAPERGHYGDDDGGVFGNRGQGRRKRSFLSDIFD